MTGSLFGGGGKFGEFLEHGSQDRSWGNARFIPRNFILDEGPTVPRAGTYVSNIGGSAKDLPSWNTAHDAYFFDYIARPRPAFGAPSRVDPSNLGVWPETFADYLSGRSFAEIDENLLLIRVENADRIARANAIATNELTDMVNEVLTRNSDPRLTFELDGLLETWQEQSDLRPVFAGFYEQVADLLPTSSTAPQAWADTLRDGFGLYHLDPVSRGKSIAIFIFRYPVSLVPRHFSSVSARAVVRPSVLDCRLSEAFCPAPEGRIDGSTVDLGVRWTAPWLEVVHAPCRWTSTHLCALGHIESGVPTTLDEARQVHLMYLQEDSPGYGEGTDGDILL